MNALPEDAARFLFPFNDENGTDAVFVSGDGGGKAGGTRADDQDIHIPFSHELLLPSEKMTLYRTG